ncbi:hypothetical protein GQ473_00335 [archaeon]|nr:hypothetical protein [archaeon]
MKIQIQVLNRIDELTCEMEDTKHSMDNGGTNLFFYMEHKRKLLEQATEIKHLCWVIDEEVPKHILALL